MKIYLDTSVISALFDKKNPERMNLTEEFFHRFSNFQIHVSEMTLLEIEHTPDQVLKEKMKEFVDRFAVLSLSEEIEQIAKDYLEYKAMPDSYREDAYHIAIAVLNEMDYVLSWNFRHIVRKKTRDVVQMVNTLRNLKHVEIITPAELL